MPWQAEQRSRFTMPRQATVSLPPQAGQGESTVEGAASVGAPFWTSSRNSSSADSLFSASCRISPESSHIPPHASQ